MSGARYLPLALLCVVVAGCGSSTGSQDPVDAVPASEREAVSAARTVDAAAFPKPKPGETLEQFAAGFDLDGPQAVPATSVFTVPRSRLAFGVVDDDLHFVYGDTVVYLQRHDHADQIEGPLPAPADVLVTAKPYRSAQAATEKDPFSAVYDVNVPVKTPGIYNVLVVSDADGGKRVAATMSIEVTSKKADAVPDVGEPAPKVATDTRASLKGNDALLDTRVPPAPELHERSFADVVGKKPVALLFATPQLCQSKVCGPVTDEMLQLKAKYGDKLDFIHQEVYVDNRVDKGLRKPLEAFNLPTEPWLFTVGKDGKIAARLEGSIGMAAFERAIEAAL